MALMMLTVQQIGSVKKNLMGLDTMVVANVLREGIALDSSNVSPLNPVVFRTCARY